MTEQKKPLIPLWATVVIVAVLMLPFLYLASLGPVYFLIQKEAIDDWTLDVVGYPLTLWGDIFGNKPEWFWKAHNKYIVWWGNLAQ